MYLKQVELFLKVVLCEGDGGPTGDVRLFQLSHQVVHSLSHNRHR